MVIWSAVDEEYTGDFEYVGLSCLIFHNWTPHEHIVWGKVTVAVYWLFLGHYYWKPVSESVTTLMTVEDMKVINVISASKRFCFYLIFFILFFQSLYWKHLQNMPTVQTDLLKITPKYLLIEQRNVIEQILFQKLCNVSVNASFPGFWHHEFYIIQVNNRCQHFIWDIDSFIY